MPEEPAEDFASAIMQITRPYSPPQRVFLIAAIVLEAAIAHPEWAVGMSRVLRESQALVESEEEKGHAAETIRTLADHLVHSSPVAHDMAVPNG